jgi:predicted site-specific integrase-resolvase
MKDKKDFLTRKDVEVILGISRSQIDRYRNSGILKAVQFVPKGRYKYRRVDVEKLLKGE